ncbi:MAG: hypothetical protein SFV18_02530 [Bryobacteraceae bacterium]|nr:hypothetical protein [Bryobacteraceae bacterium]
MRLAAVLLFAATLAAQARLTVAQLRSFVASSIKLGHDDAKVAAYLKKVQLSEKLEFRTVEDIESEGAGPRTATVLRELANASANLPAPAPAAPPKPVAGSTIPPPSREEQDRVLKSVTEYSLNYDKRLPDFICAQVTRRFYDPAGLEFWRAADTITAKLTYFQNKEEKKVLFVNNTYQDIDYDRLGGATSTGEFGSLLKEVFVPESNATFAWERWATLRGHRMYVFSYRVPRPFSKWKLIYERSLEDTPGYRGLVYVDKDTLQVMRVTLDAEDITPSFPIQAASTKLDYDYSEISERQYLLPLRAEVRMRSGKQLIKNEVEFRMYRKFGTDTSITFDTPDALPTDLIEEKPAAPAPVKPSNR